MKILIVGFGSIGKRHFQVLKDFKYIKEILIVTKQDIPYPNVYDIDHIADLNYFDYFIIANETYLHIKILNYLLARVNNKIILVEKPLFDSENDCNISSNSVYVAYNMRFHTIIKEIQKRIDKTDVLSVNMQVGQYLPNWRKGTDYRLSYSASKSRGGGVLRDLSHELDYLTQLFGKIEFKSMLKTKISDLEISSDDIFVAIGIINEKAILSLSMDYISKKTIRVLVVHTNNLTLIGNIVANTIEIHYKNGEIQKIDYGHIHRNLSFIEMHTSILNTLGENVCSFKDGLEIVKLIDKVDLK